MDDVDFLEPKLIEDEEYQCPGIYWRGNVNLFLSYHKSFEQRRSLRLLKRKSCPGCVKCGWVWEWFEEDIHNMEAADLDHIEQGALYTYKVHSHKDYEMSYYEIDYLEFVKVEEQ